MVQSSAGLALFEVSIYLYVTSGFVKDLKTNLKAETHTRSQLISSCRTTVAATKVAAVVEAEEAAGEEAAVEDAIATMVEPVSFLLLY